MESRDVRYARSGDVSIAYQVFGEGPDHVLIRLWTGDLESMWDQPLLARYFTRMAEFSRVIIFDKRGTGMSDRARAVPTLEARMDDVRAVMDAAGSERAVLSRDVLPLVRAPTLVFHRDDQPGPAQYFVERIPHSRRIELPGLRDDHAWVRPESIEIVFQETERLVAEVGREPEPDRVLATILFTDVVRSTEHAAELGDRRWRELLEQHHALVRRELARYRGQEVDTAGDGVFASFDGPARAIRCACAIRDAVQRLGLELRSGLHTGECEIAGGKPAGIAVNTGARVAAEAGAGEVLVSQTVKDLTAGSGLEFEDRGTRELKGVPGEWRLYAVVS